MLQAVRQLNLGDFVCARQAAAIEWAAGASRNPSRQEDCWCR